jgi:aryl-alcohol dehydrogenase-like predicted oxidoreductase
LTVDAATVPDRFLHGLALPLDCALALTTVADLFVGVDSCFLHAADLARVAAVGLFFATNPVEFGLRWSARRHVRADEPSVLEPAEVADALRAVAAEHRAERRCVPNATCALAPVGIGTANYSFANDLSAIGSLIGALQLGCNVVDVAGNHGGGDGGAVVGMALRRAIAGGIVTREQLFLCGKAGFTEHLATTQSRAIRAWAAAGHCIDVDFLAWEFERQTRWLGVDALDAFLLQNPEEALLRLGEDAFWTAVQSAFDYFEDLIECGRLRSYGVSTAEALRVDRESPFHLDLGDLSATARRSGGRSHGFRVLELPVGATHLEATEVRAHRRPEHDERDLTALEWAEREGMIVFASTPLNGGHDIESYGNAIADIVGLSEPGANLLQFARSLPGVTAALVGVTNPAHLTAVREVLDCAPIT